MRKIKQLIAGAEIDSVFQELARQGITSESQIKLPELKVQSAEDVKIKVEAEESVHNKLIIDESHKGRHNETEHSSS